MARETPDGFWRCFYDVEVVVRKINCEEEAAGKSKTEMSEITFGIGPN